MQIPLEVTGLIKCYPSFKLDNVTFKLQENCITGFIGINGSGKTTTIKSILGLVVKDAGKIKMFGKDMDECERELKNRIGIVLDDGYFYEDLTLTEMKSILAPAYINWDNREFLMYMERFRLNIKQKISTLSKGMRMKFALALALSHQADLLIMDEPTSGLDPLVREELMKLLKEFVSTKGKSVFFSTHITSDLEKVADVLILIDNGTVLFNSKKEELLNTHAMVHGDCRHLTDGIKKLFISLNESENNFVGLTKLKFEVQKQVKDVRIEKATIEDIMLGYV